MKNIIQKLIDYFKSWFFNLNSDEDSLIKKYMQAHKVESYICIASDALLIYSLWDNEYYITKLLTVVLIIDIIFTVFLLVSDFFDFRTFIWDTQRFMKLMNIHIGIGLASLVLCVLTIINKLLSIFLL